MLRTLRNAWKVPELRAKILFTLLILVIYRLGSAIPVPFLDPSALKSFLDSTSGSLLGYLNLLTGGAFASATLFALSISPYITASIVVQLLTVAIPALERLSKEGEEGQKKLRAINRYTTIGLAVLQGFAYYTLLNNLGAVKYTGGGTGVLVSITIILVLTAGAMLVVWLGNQIDEKGIGNGVSLILFAGIVSRVPSFFTKLYAYFQVGGYFYVLAPAVLVLLLLMIAFIVYMNAAERRIPVQYAKRVVGRKQYGGNNSFIPIKVSMSGVLPVIFASTFLSIPGTIKGFVDPNGTTKAGEILGWFDSDTILYAVLYFVLIIAFNYFYIAIQYNPVEMANNLRSNSGAIPGIRPGKPTSDFITKVINKITIVGALMLALIAILPIILGLVADMNISLGGTSVIIMVGVALDTVRGLESQMMMRHYKGFLE